MNQASPYLEPLSCKSGAEECLHFTGKVGSHCLQRTGPSLSGNDSGPGGMQTKVYVFGASSDAECWLTKLSGPEMIIDWSFS